LTQIGRKVYYDKATGNVYVITAEMSGDVVETTQDQDFQTYTALHGIDPATVGVKQLAYGEHANEFALYRCSRVDLTSGQLIWDTINNGTLDDAKKQKLAQLAYFRDQEIYSTFQSSALGTTKTYNYNREAYENFRGEAILLNLDPTISSVNWATVEDGFVTHTRDQFIQVIKDGASHEKNAKMKYYQLEAQVNAATTIDQVNAIVW
jgi:hypothetical protein